MLLLTQDCILNYACFNMGNDDLLTDDHVAELLAKEAKDCSSKYSTMGMEAYTSSPSSSRFAKTRHPRNSTLRPLMHRL